ncbi:UPF0182 family protein [Tomitella biformata]|uniref:UPF0182 family protein n=1 Tax=Tomitella biformata TaxID=630403 RepID=UPI000465B8FB|nr:UPF0182 family protein [Tomitella biformata]
MGVRPSSGIPQLSRRSKILLGLGLVVVLGLLFGPRLLGIYIDWLWFRSVDYGSVFSTVVLTRIIIFAVVAIFVAATIFGSILIAYRTRSVFVPVSNPHDPVARYRSLVMGKRKTFALGIPIVIGLISGLVAQDSWQMVQLFFNGGDFGIQDPQFGYDIGFYVFTLPFIQAILSWLFVALFIAFFAALVTHYIFGGIRLAVSEGRLTRAARAQLAIIAGLFLLVKAVAYWFDRYALLSNDSKMPTFAGAGYSDIHAVLPSKLILMAIAVLCALVFFAAIVLRDLRIPALATALMVLSSVLIGAVYPLIVEQFSVKPNAAQKESEYITRNIQATRDAYGINNVTDGGDVTYQSYPGASTKSPVNVPADHTTIENLRLLDPNILSPTFTARQQLKNFYGFPDMLNIDRYEVDGELQDFVLAPRELAPGSFTGNQTDWINRHTVYTHGNGIVAAPANTVTSSPGAGQESAGGYPVFTVSDLTVQSDIDALKVDQPRIYFGELIAKTPQDYSIVGAAGSAPREYDTETEKYTYTGKDGVPISNWINRLAFAAKYGERNILFSNAIGSDSKIIFNRDPRDRVQEVAPWLTTDAGAYPAVVDGRIQWIVDGYTTLENYPYAQRASLDDLVSDSVDAATGRPLPKKEVSYIRNSVKATVDAYDGTVTLYEFDENDPVLKAWSGVFPGTVKPKGEISEDLNAHIRYPEDLFKVQREMLAKYHVDEPTDFFTNDAFWTVPTDPTVETDKNQPPYYLLMGNPETATPEFLLTSPMRGYQRDFLSAYISVSSDPKTYGQILVRTLPTDSQTQGPNQAQNSMVSDAKVSTEVALLKQANKVQYGNLLTLPIADGGILYVGPLYTERNSTTGGTFPQLTRVLMSYTDSKGGVKVGYAQTVQEALSQIFGADTAGLATRPAPEGEAAPAEPANPEPGTDGSTTPAETPTTPAPTPAPTGDAAAAGVAVNDAMKELKTAQTSGDFAAYGKALEDLDKAIANWQAVTGNTGN